MGIGEKAVDVVGGAAKDGFGWGIKGVILGGIIGAIAMGGLGFLAVTGAIWAGAALHVLVAGAGAAAAGVGFHATLPAFFALGKVGMAAASIGGVVMAGLGAWAGAAKGGLIGAPLGVIKGGFSGLFGRGHHTPEIQRQTAIETERNLELLKQQRQANIVAAGANNTAPGNVASKLQSQQQTQQPVRTA